MDDIGVEGRLSTVRDILYCEDECSRTAYEKILDMWSSDAVSDLEHSRNISAFKAEELSLMNRLFGSSANCIAISDTEIQKLILKLMPNDLYKNFRRATYKRPMAITIEEWLWLEPREFMDELDVELTCLENIIVGLLLYFLGGFTVPIDNLKRHMQDWIKVDVTSIFNRPRELFLLTNLSPGILSRFTYWKCTSVLMGLMRLFAKKIQEDALPNLKKRLEYEGYVD